MIELVWVYGVCDFYKSFLSLSPSPDGKLLHNLVFIFDSAKDSKTVQGMSGKSPAIINMRKVCKAS